MDVANREDFLACLDKHLSRNGLQVFAFSKRHLLTAVEEVGFEDFRGRDYEVISRLRELLRVHGSESALWGLVFIDLWYCSNFGGRHWEELVARDPANIRYAIEAAHWIFAVSKANGGRRLAVLINRYHCGSLSEQYIRQHPGDGLRAWWQCSVLPYTLRGQHRTRRYKWDE